MRKLNLSLCIVCALALVLAAGCGGSTPIFSIAQRYAGGSLSNFGGADGNDPEARQRARDLLVDREWNLPTPGGVIAQGRCSTIRAGADLAFGDGDGDCSFTGDVCTAVFDIEGANPEITGVTITGVFSRGLAQSALTDPAVVYPVTWTITYTESGTTFNLTTEQMATGTGYRQS